MLRDLCSGLGTTCPLASAAITLVSAGGGLRMPSFSEASEFKLALALAPPGVGEAGFAPFGAPLKVGIWD